MQVCMGQGTTGLYYMYMRPSAFFRLLSWEMALKSLFWFSLIGLKLMTADLVSHIIKPESIASRES